MADRLGQPLASDLWRVVEGTRGDASLVHADFKPWNLLVGHEGCIAGVLDWEFAFAGSALFDLGIFLRHDRSLPRDYRSSFIAGYLDAGGSLPADWHRLIKLLDLLNLCQLLERAPATSPAVGQLRGLVAATVAEAPPG
jgi:fructokinase